VGGEDSEEEDGERRDVGEKAEISSVAMYPTAFRGVARLLALPGGGGIGNLLKADWLNTGH
jgi:hypothetical protein